MWTRDSSALDFHCAWMDRLLQWQRRGDEQARTSPSVSSEDLLSLVLYLGILQQLSLEKRGQLLKFTFENLCPMPQSCVASVKGTENIRKEKKLGCCLNPEGQTTTRVTREPYARTPKPSYNISIVSFLSLSLSLIFNLFGCAGS